MINNDEALIQTRHLVLEETCRPAWNDQLDEGHREEMVYKIIPGPKPVIGRCYIYKGREIVRHRTGLVCGENLMENLDSKNEVQVIKPACDECPLSSYTVTDNCRLCLGKACLSSCHFDAVTIREFRSHVDPEKCKECGMCVQSCPYGAVMHLVRPCKKACPVDAITHDEYGFCIINKQKCIECGRCIHSCPFGAINAKSYLVNVIQEIKAGKEVIAMYAPATERQLGEKVGIDSIRNALKKISFADMVEADLGGDMTAAYGALEWSEARKEDKKMTTSRCPAFINLLKERFPQQYEESTSTTVSPMCAVSRYLKTMHPGCVTIFIGPCVVKESESADKLVPDNADYVMTYDEFSAFLRPANVQLEPEETERQEASIFGKCFATSGGVANMVLECMSERGEDVSEIKLLRCVGGAECKKALQFLKLGRVVEDFIEGMVCPGGCVGGPSKHRTEIEIKRSRETLLKRVGDRKVLDNLKNYPIEKFSMHRDGRRDLEELKHAGGEAQMAGEKR